MRFSVGMFAVVAAACGSTMPAGPVDALTDSPIDAPVTPGAWPPASAGHDLVYVTSLGSVVLVNAGLGGATSPPQATPTTLWAWNGTAWTVLAEDGPPIRNLGGVAYDAARDELVLHGGTYSVDVSYGDTWTWQSGRGWQEKAGTGPGVRDHVQMTYDAARQRVVLFGGQASLTQFPATTWTWDGTTWTMIPIASGANPSPRVHHAMTYDPTLSEVVMFGGYEPGVRDRGDTWIWNGTAWSDSGAERTGRTHGRMAFDANRSAAILVGAINPDPVLLRDASGWRDLAVTGGPGARYLPGIAFDAQRNVLVVFGGGNPTSDQLYDDVWELDATGWRSITQ